MEKLYRKNNKGRYEEIGYNGIPDISDGIWIVQSKPNSKSYNSMFWKIGNLERPVDVVTHASLQTLSDDLSSYLMKLGDNTSKEWQEAKETLGGYLTEPIRYYNISASDLVSLFIRRIATHLEETENIKLRDIMQAFTYTLDYSSNDYSKQLEILHKFQNFFEKRF